MSEPPPAQWGRDDEKPGLHLLVVDARKLTRDCLIAALEASPDFNRTVGAANLQDATAELRNDERFDATLFNFANDEFNDIELADLRRILVSRGCSDAIIVLTVHTDGAHIASGLRQGIRGLLSIDTPLDVTIDAIRLVSKGWLVYPPIDPAVLSSPMRRPDVTGPIARPDLTPRRRQVLERLQQGMTNRDIARQLSVSERTIKAHVQELMRTLGANNRTQVVALTSGQRPPLDQSNDD